MACMIHKNEVISCLALIEDDIGLWVIVEYVAIAGAYGVTTPDDLSAFERLDRAYGQAALNLIDELKVKVSRLRHWVAEVGFSSSLVPLSLVASACTNMTTNAV